MNKLNASKTGVSLESESLRVSKLISLLDSLGKLPLGQSQPTTTPSKLKREHEVMLLHEGFRLLDYDNSFYLSVFIQGKDASRHVMYLSVEPQVGLLSCNVAPMDGDLSLKHFFEWEFESDTFLATYDEMLATLKSLLSGKDY